MNVVRFRALYGQSAKGLAIIFPQTETSSNPQDHMGGKGHEYIRGKHGHTTSRLINERCFNQFTFTKARHEKHEQQFPLVASLPYSGRVGVRRGVPSLAPRETSEGFREHDLTAYIPRRELSVAARSSSSYTYNRDSYMYIRSPTLDYVFAPFPRNPGNIPHVA